MKLRVLEHERFTCAGCTNCCREPYVELMPDDLRTLRSLAWPKGDPLHGVEPIRAIGGKPFLAKTLDPRGDTGGVACVYLDLATGRCRVHEKFGHSSKPLGCRVFPFRLAPTFDGEVSAGVRFECPTVRLNQGLPHADHRRQLERDARSLGLAVGFNEVTRCLLSRAQIAAVVDFIITLAPALGDDERRALFLACLCDWLERQPVNELSRESLGRAFADLKAQAESAAAAPVNRPDWARRLAFRTLLALHLRRDEDLLNGKVGRLSRALSTAALALGRGGFRGVGLLHPAGSLRQAGLFKSRLPVEDHAMELPWRAVRTRLESFQFLGASNGGRDFLEGLRSLALLYPLVLAAAKYRAANRGAASIGAEDVDYAVAAIEHSFGRLPILASPMARRLGRMLERREALTRLLRTI